MVTSSNGSKSFSLAGALRGKKVKESQAPLPNDHALPGFNNRQYLLINEDVAAAGITDGLQHYVQYGRAELRTLLAPGQGIADQGSRLLDSSQRQDWKNVIDNLCQSKSIRSILAGHPRSGWLKAGFTLAGYLQERKDVALQLAGDDPRKAAFHYLEFGLEEGTSGVPYEYDREHVTTHYGFESLDQATNTTKVLSTLLTDGVDPLEISLNEAQYWELQGFYGTAMVEAFDHEYYHAISSRSRADKLEHSRTACIEDFLQRGIENIAPMQRDLRFDAEFYAQEIEAEPHKEGVSALYRHWLTVGLRKGISPNLCAFGRRKSGLEVPPCILEQLNIFSKAAGLPVGTNKSTALEHLITSPRPGAAALSLSSDASVEFLASIADKQIIQGKGAQGEWLYWHILASRPGHGRTTLHLADLMQRAGRTDVSLCLRKQITTRATSGWNHLNLADICLQDGLFEEAADYLISMPSSYDSDVDIASKRAAIARRAFHLIWDNISNHVSAYGIERTQDQLRRVLQACTPRFSTAESNARVQRIALIGNDDLPQCKLYRVDQKAEQLRSAGYEVSIFSPHRDIDAFLNRIDDYQAAIFFRVAGFPSIIDAITAAAQHGVLTFYEIDDVVFDAAHFPPAYESYAGQISKAQYAIMACGVPLFEHAMSICDYGIASTASIANLMKKRVRTGQVFEHHNALSRPHALAIKENLVRSKVISPKSFDKRPVVLFYGSGTRAHKEDFHEILEPALAEIVRRYPGRVEVQLIGHFGQFNYLDLNQDPVSILEPVWDFEEYCSHLAGADINLSVLSESLLTDAKSEIKWMEAAMFAIPSVLSSTATHREVIDDGKTGILCRGTKEFIDALDKLVRSEDLRIQIGNNARNVALKNYSLQAMGENLAGMFTALRPEGSGKKKLLVVNVFYPPQAIGGATRVVHDNVKDLHDRYGDEYEIDVICTLEGGTTPLEVKVYADSGVRVWAITAVGLEGGDMAPHDPRVAGVFERLLEKIQPDLVHFHCIQRLTASVVDVVRLLEIPYVITLHDAWWISPNQFVIDDKGKTEVYDYSSSNGSKLPDRARALLRPLLGASRLLAVSESFADIYRQAGLSNVVTIENGVSPLRQRPKVPSHSGKLRLAHIGGATRHKGLHLLYNSLLANDYKNFELLLIDHSLPAEVRIHEVWGTTNVTRTGKVPQDQVSDLYSKIDLLLAPSTWPESYGLVTREAMSQGVWVIASNIGAIGDDVVEGVNGFRVDVSDYSFLEDLLWRIDGDHTRYLSPPSEKASLRTASDQVDELVLLYGDIIRAKA